MMGGGDLMDLPQQALEKTEQWWDVALELWYAVPLWARITVGAFLLVSWVASRWWLPALSQWRASGRKD